MLALFHHHPHIFYFVMLKKPIFNLSQCPSFIEMSNFLMYVLDQHLSLLRCWHYQILKNNVSSLQW